MKYPRITLISFSICLALLLSGCGGGTANSASDASAPASSAPAAATGGWETSDMALASQDSVEKYQSSSVYQNSDAKLIREASLNVQTTQFDQALADLEQLVTQLGGYFQDAAVYGGTYRDVNANRSGEYTIRVPAEQYEQCLNRTG